MPAIATDSNRFPKLEQPSSLWSSGTADASKTIDSNHTVYSHYPGTSSPSKPSSSAVPKRLSSISAYHNDEEQAKIRQQALQTALAYVSLSFQESQEGADPAKQLVEFADRASCLRGEHDLGIKSFKNKEVLNKNMFEDPITRSAATMIARLGRVPTRKEALDYLPSFTPLAERLRYIDAANKTEQKSDDTSSAESSNDN